MTRVNNSLKSQVFTLRDDLARIKEENKTSLQNKTSLLIVESENLKTKVETLTNDLAKFTQGKKNLDILLGSQKCCFNKSGIGYDSFDDQKSYSYMIKKSSTSYILCNFCGKSGHISHTCPIKKRAYSGIKFVWILKVKKTVSNTKGPKMI